MLFILFLVILWDAIYISGDLQVTVANELKWVDQREPDDRKAVLRRSLTLVGVLVGWGEYGIAVVLRGQKVCGRV